MNTTERELLEQLKILLPELRDNTEMLVSALPEKMPRRVYEKEVAQTNALIKGIEACLEKPVQEDQPQPDSLCQEDDGCPTEVAVLKRFWRCHQAKPVQEPSCNPHPNAPHGFSRNASHSANRYVCECEGWSEKENMQQEPVQEPVAWAYQEYKRVFMDFNWFDEVAFIQPPSDSEQFRNVVSLYASPQSRELQPLVQIASDIMGACMNGDLSDKWEDVADLLVSNNFDGLSKLTQSLEPMSEDEILEAIARGWCHAKNVRKEMDSDLAIAIASEVSQAIKTQH